MPFHLPPGPPPPGFRYVGKGKNRKLARHVMGRNFQKIERDPTLKGLQQASTTVDPTTSSPSKIVMRWVNKAKLARDLPGVVRPGYNYYYHVADWRQGAQFTPEVKQARFANIAKQGLMYQEYQYGMVRPFISGPWQADVQMPASSGLETGPTTAYHRPNTRGYLIEIPEGVKHLKEIGKKLTEAEVKANVARHEAMYPDARLARAQGYTHRLPPEYIVGHIDEGRFTPFPETAARVGKEVLKSPTVMSRLSRTAGKAAGAAGREAKIFARNMPAGAAGALFYELLPPIGGTPLGTSLHSLSRKAGEGSDIVPGAEERRAAQQEKAREDDYWRTHTPDVRQMSLPEQLRYEEFQEEEAPKKELTLYEQAFPLTSQAAPEFEFPVHPTGQQKQEDRLSVVEEAVRMDKLKKRAEER